MKIAIVVAAVCLLALIEVSFAATGIKVGPVTHGNVRLLELRDYHFKNLFLITCIFYSANAKALK